MYKYGDETYCRSLQYVRSYSSVLTPLHSYSYLRIRYSTFLAVLFVLIRKYAHICLMPIILHTSVPIVFTSIRFSIDFLMSLDFSLQMTSASQPWIKTKNLMHELKFCEFLNHTWLTLLELLRFDRS